MSDALYNKYRPCTWDMVFGQNEVMKRIPKLIKEGSHAFLLTGPSGVGKTTIARIAAEQLHCDIMPVDAATNTGVDEMRAVMQIGITQSFNETGRRAIIVDEAHRLSGNAWDSMLLMVEEPPRHLYWFFCTTNAAKVPATIKSRCVKLELKPIPEKELGLLFDYVCEEEKIKLPGDVGDFIIRSAKGSARELLTNLALCREAKDKRQAAALLNTALETDATIELCRALSSNKTWMELMSIYKRLDDQSPEGVRIVVCHYMAKAAAGAKSSKDAAYFLNILEAFSDGYNPAEGAAPLLRSIGRVAFAP